MTPDQAQHILRACDRSTVSKGAAMHMLQAVILRNTAGGIRVVAADHRPSLDDAEKLEAAAEVLERHGRIMREALPVADAFLDAAHDMLAEQRRSEFTVISEGESDGPA